MRGRFARNDDTAAVMPHETKKALAEKARKEKKASGRRPVLAFVYWLLCITHSTPRRLAASHESLLQYPLL